MELRNKDQIEIDLATAEQEKKQAIETQAINIANFNAIRQKIIDLNIEIEEFEEELKIWNNITN